METTADYVNAGLFAKSLREHGVVIDLGDNRSAAEIHQALGLPLPEGLVATKGAAQAILARDRTQ
jgi:hypothetical protein